MKLDDLVAAARSGADEPTPQDRRRLRARLASRLELEASGRYPRVGGAEALVLHPVSGVGRSRPRRWMVRALLAAAVLVVGTASALGARRVLAARAHRQPAVVVDLAPARPAPATEPPSPPAAPATATPEAVPAAVKRAPSAPRFERPARAAGAIPGTLADEMALVQQARSALQRGDADEALADCDRYDALYRRGTLRQEAAGLRVLALCDAGRVDEARARGAAFLRAWPRSPLAARVHASCATPRESDP